MAIFNLLFLYTRLMKAGVDQGPIVEAIAYLILATLRHGLSDRLQEVMEIASEPRAVTLSGEGCGSPPWSSPRQSSW